MIESDEPEVLLMSPPRRGLSVARVPNWNTMDPQERDRVEQESIMFWGPCVQVAMFQLSEGSIGLGFVSLLKGMHIIDLGVLFQFRSADEFNFNDLARLIRV